MNQTHKPKGATQVTDGQKKLLVEYMRKNQCLQSGKFSNKFTYRDAQSKWNEIADILNSMPGSTKDWKSWRKTWQDLKSRSKGKIAQNQKNARKTGGGPSEENPLTSTEEDIIDIVKMVSISGHSESMESPLAHDDDVNNDDHDYLDINNEEIIEHCEELQTERSSNYYTKDSENYKTPSMKSTSKNQNRVKACIPSTPNIPKKTKVNHTLSAIKASQKGLNERTEIKQKYYEEKLKIMERIATAKEKSAEYRERIAVALETIADSL